MNAKINQLHGVNALDVEDASDNRQDSRWVINDAGQWRLMVKGRTSSGRLIGMVLWPTERDGEWNLATAFAVS